MKRISALILILLFVIFTSSQALANHKEQVLGSSTDSKDVEFPPVTYGPGLLLPDSPFYVLDSLKQKVKIMLAMGPRSKSLIHAQIAGERIAELRVMMERGNKAGIQTALASLSYEVDQAVNDMNDAAAQGKDVAKLTELLNNQIKEQRKILTAVSSQTSGELYLLTRAANESLYAAKAEVEEKMRPEDKENEIADAILDQMDSAVLGLTNTKTRIETATETLRKQSSQAAQRALTQKRKQLDEAKKTNDKTRIRTAEQALQAETKKQSELFKAQEEALKQVITSFENAQTSGDAYRIAKEILLKLKLENTTQTAQ